jgi:acyl-CoA thioesterase-1
MLDGVATDRKLMQPDGIHPTVEAQPLLLTNVWPHLEALLENQDS